MASQAQDSDLLPFLGQFQNLRTQYESCMALSHWGQLSDGGYMGALGQSQSLAEEVFHMEQTLAVPCAANCSARSAPPESPLAPVDGIPDQRT